MNEKWYKSVVVLLGTIMLIIQAITMIYIVGINPNGFTHVQKIIQSFIAIAMIGLLIIFMVMSLKKKKMGPILGMVVGLEYTFSYTIINLIVGVAFFVCCLSLLVALCNEEAAKDKKEEKEEDIAKA